MKPHERIYEWQSNDSADSMGYMTDVESSNFIHTTQIQTVKNLLYFFNGS